MDMVIFEGLLRRYKLSLISDNELTLNEQIIVDIIVDGVTRYKLYWEEPIMLKTDIIPINLKYVRQRYVTDILEKIKATNLVNTNTNIDLSEWFD